MASTIFTNAKLVLKDRVCEGSLLVEDGVISGIYLGEARGETGRETGRDKGRTGRDKGGDIGRDKGEDTGEKMGGEISADRKIDVRGCYLAPGFIDIHTHGGGGADFMDGDLDSIYTASAMHLRHGTTSIVPTTVASTKQSLLDFIDLFNQVDLHRPGCPNILGLHLEGPYFAYSQRGAQDPKYLRCPRPDEYEAVLEQTDRVLRWSFAVELEGSLQFLERLKEHGVIASLAHSDATCEEVIRAHENGVRAMAHFYSCMSDIKRVNAFRVAGAVQAGYLLDDMYIELIADGCHLPKELIWLAYKEKGPDRICLVTDSMRAAGMPDDSYILGCRDNGLHTIVEDGVAKLPDRSAFAGSVATADRLLRTVKQWLPEEPLCNLVRMLTLTPAALMNIQDRKGSLEVGKDADLIVFDSDVQIRCAMVMGEMAYQDVEDGGMRV